MRFSDEPNPHVPAADPGSVAAAVFLERLVEDPSAENPPMNDEEAIRGSPGEPQRLPCPSTHVP
jgi:hypothetical protein